LTVAPDPGVDPYLDKPERFDAHAFQNCRALLDARPGEKWTSCTDEFYADNVRDVARTKNVSNGLHGQVEDAADGTRSPPRAHCPFHKKCFKSMRPERRQNG
jgi:hypothetical protein